MCRALVVAPWPIRFQTKTLLAKNAVAYNIKGQIIKLDKSKLYGNLRRGILKVKMVFCARFSSEISITFEVPCQMSGLSDLAMFSVENVCQKA